MTLRMIELITSIDSEKAIEEEIKKCQILEYWLTTIGNNYLLVKILVLSEQSEDIIGKLDNKFNTILPYRMVLYNIDATLPQPDRDEEKDQNNEHPKRVSIAELVETLNSEVGLNSIFITLTILSTIVASVGLLENNSTVIIGAMVIAPFLAPNMLLAFAITLGEITPIRRSIIVNGTGFIITFVIAALIGLLFPIDTDSEMLNIRTRIHISDIIVALAAGSAGSLAFTTGLPAALVGVMVAVALVPSLATAGMCAGAGQWTLSFKAFLLFLTNVTCINFSAFITFLLQGIKPKQWWKQQKAKKYTLFATLLWLTFLLFVIIFIIVKAVE